MQQEQKPKPVTGFQIIVGQLKAGSGLPKSAEKDTVFKQQWVSPNA
jgi:hypothetical protein